VIVFDKFYAKKIAGVPALSEHTEALSEHPLQLGEEAKTAKSS
jgi:hypothetical protein